MPSEALNKKLLSGLRVLEFGQNVAGPFCTYLMAALGAEVLKIEPPVNGDPAREAGPFPDNIPHPEKSALFLYLNAGKKSITLDASTGRGATLLRDMVARADILVENLPAPAAASLGLDYGTLASINPRLVLTSISTFGRRGPYSSYKGDELVGSAMGGWMYVLGVEEGFPVKYGGYPASYTAGYAALAGSLAAYHYACIAGRGQHVDVSLMECVASTHSQALVERAYTGQGPFPRGLSMTYPCKDGIVWAVFQQHQWPNVAKLIGHPELIADPRFKTMTARQQNHEELAQYILPWMMERTKEDIYNQAQDLRLPFGFLADVADVQQSPQMIHRQFFVEVDHPVAGRQVHPGLPVHKHGAEWQLGPAPTLGQHNEEIICGLLGYGATDLEEMRSEGTV